MTTQGAVKILRQFNKWRRDNEGKEKCPTDIGIAIDTICDKMEAIMQVLEVAEIAEDATFAVFRAMNQKR